MKIRGTLDGNESGVRAAELIQTELLRGKGRAIGQGANEQGVNKLRDRQVDNVNVALSKAIHQELNPQEMLEGRRQRVEELKLAVQAGKYNPPSEDVARGVIEEIAYEIFFSGDAGGSSKGGDSEGSTDEDDK